MQAIRLYWCRGKGRSDKNQQNFGDYLSPMIVEAISNRKVQYTEARNADLLAIGSILNRESKARFLCFPRSIHIWGTGSMTPECRYSKRHHYHAVRGRLTHAQIDMAPPQMIYGDPGLLVDRLAGPSPQKKYRLGIIPHYVDQTSPFSLPLLNQSGVKFINVFSPISQILNEIRSCHYILSSSMHGLIVSDALGVPNSRLKFSSEIEDYKFTDYYSAFGIDSPAVLYAKNLITTELDIDQLSHGWDRPGIELIKRKLELAFPTI